MPALGISLILITVGAILAFAVTTAVEGVDIAVVGAILMIVGAFGILLSLLFLMSFSPFSRQTTYVETTDHGHVDPPVDHAHR